MAFRSFREVKNAARLGLHSRLSGVAFYLATPGTTPGIPITVREHYTLTKTGEIAGADMRAAFAATIQDDQTRLVFLRSDVEMPARYAIVSISPTLAYQVMDTEEPDGLTIKALVVREDDATKAALYWARANANAILTLPTVVGSPQIAPVSLTMPQPISIGTLGSQPGIGSVSVAMPSVLVVPEMVAHSTISPVEVLTPMVITMQSLGAVAEVSAVRVAQAQIVATDTIAAVPILGELSLQQPQALSIGTVLANALVEAVGVEQALVVTLPELLAEPTASVASVTQQSAALTGSALDMNTTMLVGYMALTGSILDTESELSSGEIATATVEETAAAAKAATTTTVQ